MTNSIGWLCDLYSFLILSNALLNDDKNIDLLTSSFEYKYSLVYP